MRSVQTMTRDTLLHKLLFEQFNRFHRAGDNTLVGPITCGQRDLTAKKLLDIPLWQRNREHSTNR